MSGPPIWAPGQSEPAAPPGWYADPERPGWWRWWDGRVWTDQRAPMGPSEPSGRPATSLSRWFDRSWKDGVAATRTFLPLLAALWLLVAAAYVGVSLWLLGRPEVDTFRDELGLNDEFQPTDTTDTITDAEADAALDALGDLVVPAISSLVVLSVLSWAVAAWTVALIVRRLDRTRPTSTAAPDDDDGDGALAALRRTPAVMASWLVVGLLGLAVWVVAFAPMVLLIVAEVRSDDSFVLAIVIAAVFGTIAALAGFVFLVPRIGLAPLAAALGDRGLGLAHVWRLTSGRWGATAVRLLLMYLISAAVTIPFGFVVQGAGLLGTTAFAIAIAINQAVVALASSLVYATGGAVFLVDAEAVDRTADDADVPPSVIPPTITAPTITQNRRP